MRDMPFNEIKPIEKAKHYLDVAITRAKKKVNLKKVRGDRLEKIKTLELTKIAIMRDILISRIKGVYESFPKAEDLTDFYNELIEYNIGSIKLKKEVNKIKITYEKIDEIFKKLNKDLKRTTSLSDIKRIMGAFYGRTASLLKHIDFEFLEESRRKLQSFPLIRQRYKQIAIAGFPNVGKSTLLGKISSSQPKIAHYAFTTKGIMIGYCEDNQLLDTPGTLNRLNKMNDIEKQAFLVMKMIAEKIIYVFDLTEPYPIEDQIELYEKIKEFKKPIMIYLSKTDVLPKEKIKEFSKKYKVIIDSEKLKKELKKNIDKNIVKKRIKEKL